MKLKSKRSMVIIDCNAKATGVLSVNITLAMKRVNHSVYKPPGCFKITWLESEGAEKELIEMYAGERPR